ncbi:TrfB-related DNA-binding protein [Methylosarcina fibrata]|uniref:TrfB-related DNA-binding protein n=1 Tax=Methylosarcina fibrata TaxID=105972 RepID=UPI00035F0287|nr:TrfB-related DNA-binding protein [Methylosarcina fibrata]
MAKLMSMDEFREAIKGLDMGSQNLEIAEGVLVRGEQQTMYMQKFGLSRGAVSQTVNRVRKAHQELLINRSGMERVTVVLPEHQAFIVKKWAEDALKRKKRNES